LVARLKGIDASNPFPLLSPIALKIKEWEEEWFVGNREPKKNGEKEGYK